MSEQDRQFEEWLRPFSQENGLSTVQPKNADADTPTQQAYADPDTAYAFLNERFFDGALPNCVITFNRRSDGATMLRKDAFTRVDGVEAHEISLNLPLLAQADERQVLATILCAQVSLWDRIKRGDKSGGARAYHGLRWARKMEEVGLTPIARATGKKTGYAMSFEIAPGGPFDLDCAELLASGFRLRWRDKASARGSLLLDEDARASGDVHTSPSGNTRTRFVCRGCGLKAWARPTAQLACRSCDLPLDAS